MLCVVMQSLLLLCICLHLLVQDSSACTPHAHILHGVGLGAPVMSRSNSTTWRACCDYCSAKSGCIAWTYLKKEKTCLLRDKVGTNFNFKAQNRISCIMDSSKLPTQRRDESDVWVHIGILSGPDNHARVTLRCGRK